MAISAGVCSSCRASPAASAGSAANQPSSGSTGGPCPSAVTSVADTRRVYVYLHGSCTDAMMPSNLLPRPAAKDTPSALATGFTAPNLCGKANRMS